MADPEVLSISDVAATTGLETSALRYYEKVGLIKPAGRAGGRRQYEPSVLQRLAAVALFQEAGFTISEVGELLDAGINRGKWRSMAEEKLHEIDEHLERVTAARALLASAVRCECSGIDTCGLVSARRGRHRSVVQSLARRATSSRT
jgi:MerR family transcriptional regulator, redox-sensitive transcriptional activator SoxR